MARDEPPDAQRCRDCGGELVRGSLAFPVLGAPRFSHRLGTNEVQTEVDGEMCVSCGRVTLRGRDPQRIALAVAAGRTADQYRAKPGVPGLRRRRRTGGAPA